jgi:opacity protein-like surface antigen
MKHTVFAALVLFASQIIAQPVRLHIGGGFANYNGDLQAKALTLNQARGVVSAGGTFNITPKIAIRSDYSFAHLGADDKRNPRLADRNLNFKTIIQELSLVGEYDLFDLSDKVWTPYAFAGVGVFRFSPYTVDRANQKVFLHGLGTEGQGLAQYPERTIYKKTQLNIPIGGGIKYAVSDDIYVAAEFGFRKLFTDHLDDVSGPFADENALLAGRGPLAVDLAFRGDEVKSNSNTTPQTYPAAGSQRGNPKYKDAYYFGQIRLSFRMPWFDNGGSYGREGKRSKYGCPRIM